MAYLLRAAALLLATLGAGAVPQYFPSGVQLKVPLNQVINGGWRICSNLRYGDWTQEDMLRTTCGNSPFIMFAAIDPAFPTELSIAAAGFTPSVLQWTYTNTDTHLHNGVYWYFFHYYSVGFSNTPDVYLTTADVQGLNAGACERRISWHTMNYNYGGFRAGCAAWLNSYQEDRSFRKLVLVANDGCDECAPMNLNCKGEAQTHFDMGHLDVSIAECLNPELVAQQINAFGLNQDGRTYGCTRSTVPNCNSIICTRFVPAQAYSSFRTLQCPLDILYV